MPTVPLPLPARGLRRIKLNSSAIEHWLVRTSVGALAEGRATCRHCRRTPLVGERVHLYAGKRGEDLVCSLCRPMRAADPDRTVVVRPSEQRGSVRAVPVRP